MTSPSCVMAIQGKVLIYEMAMQMEQKGLKVDALYIFDGAPYFPRELAATSDASGSFTDKVLDAMQALHGHRPNGLATDFDRLPEKAKVRQLYQHLSTNALLQTDEHNFTRQLSLFMQQVELSQQYDPQHGDQLHCPVHLFRCQENGLSLSEDYGWGAVTTGPVKVHYLDSNHMDLLKMPAIGEIGEVMKRSGVRE